MFLISKQITNAALLSLWAHKFVDPRLILFIMEKYIANWKVLYVHVHFLMV